MEKGPTGSLDLRWREASEEELLELLERHADELDAGAVGQVLVNPFASSRVIERLLASRNLLAFYEVKRSIARHPRCPEIEALKLLPGLFWRDLVRIGSDIRIGPVVRRAADRQLSRRLPGLSVGERQAIARSAGAGLIATIRHDPEVRVIRGLLENPRLTEGALSPLLTSDAARPEVLTEIARNRRWGARNGVRVAICRNPRTPVATAQQLLPMLQKKDLRDVASDRRLAAAVRRRADLLLGRSGGPGI